DLIGREPLDAEMSRDVAFLRAGELGAESRRQLISRLQTDENGGATHFCVQGLAANQIDIEAIDIVFDLDGRNPLIRGGIVIRYDYLLSRLLAGQ
ncbi:MAG: hypothetical protein AAFP02_23630, partial [Bacteroidota bacterium]